MVNRPSRWDEPQHPLDFDEPIAETPASAPRPGLGAGRRQPQVRRLSRTLGILALAGAIAGGVLVYQSLQLSELYLLNGFDLPLRVSLDVGDETFDVDLPERNWTTRQVSGDVTVRVETLGGVEIARDDITVPRGTDLVVYNILGMAAVFLEEVIYTSDELPLGVSPTGTVENLSGQVFLTRDPVDYIFRAPPSEIQIDSSSDRVSRWHFGYVGDGGWLTAVNSLITTGNDAEARNIVDAVLSFDPQNSAAQRFDAILNGQSAPWPTQTPQPPRGGGPIPGRVKGDD